MAEPDYKELYFRLFGEVSDISDKLTEIQKKFENLYCETGELKKQ